MVARGRRTERRDKEEDKCERRRGMRVKKIYGIKKERTRVRKKEWRLRKHAKKIAADTK